MKFKFIFLDTRFFRSKLKGKKSNYIENIEPDATILGNAQWAWLENELKSDFDFLFIFSSIQIIAKDHRFEKWSNFPNERAKLFELLEQFNDKTILFCALTMKGGWTIQKYEMPIYDKKYKDILPFANKNAFLENWIWKESLKESVRRTRKQRGANLFGQFPKRNLALYSDNCTMHSTIQAKRTYARLWKVHERALIPNATHVQQPVDQHVGNFIQEYVAGKYWDYGEESLDEIDDGKREDGDKVGIKAIR